MATAPRPRYTQVQQRILDMLSDGMAHTKQELNSCLMDDQPAANNGVTWHVVRLRKLLAPFGQTIVCETRNRRCLYRHVILLKPDVD